ncbi:SARP family transcriptional regulator [Nonomuraea turkmeniaca]|uniref:SARP family transcriptional regulator n=1 Tax=Nonomuraea turkmeniaca TaxID=103838 RepID=A0A5S4F1B6_9ACTN|nr:BTAD domain-containing putative transcriptional regulator [Nonomuraea turkmeniaca]TMR09873.1 SARP family transcriptional regulator [Nonomuraea turkmeniaca]
MAVRFRVLGRVEFTADGNVVDLGSRQREVLALMLLRANDTVTVGQLVEVAYADSAPESARRQIQNTVGRLRRTLTAAGCPDVIKTMPGGYLLEAGPDTLDLLEYAEHVEAGRRAAAEGRDQQAIASLRRGLALWRGPFLADIDAPGLEAEQSHMREARMAVHEECVELELRLGRHRELLSELAAVTAEHPLCERMWELRMLALYRCGAKAEALALYQDARMIFLEELGLEPGRRLKRLEQAILADDPALDLDRRPGQLPPDVPGFTGRDEAKSTLEAVLPPSPARATPVIVITGKAGVGKTALAVHVAHRLRESFPDGQLFAALRDVRGRRVPPGDVLAQFLRALGEPAQELPDGVHERAARFRDCLARRRVLVVLDDAVDEAQVGPLLPGGAECAVLVTSRSKPALAGMAHLKLEELEPLQAMAFLAGVAGADRVSSEPQAAHELIRLCGGLPLALRIVGARLAGRRIVHMVERLKDVRRQLGDLEDLEVRGSIALSAEELDPAALRLLCALAHGDTPELPDWTALAAGGTQDLLDSLVDAQLLQVAGPLRYRLHDVVRDYARDLGEPESMPRVLGGWLALVERAHHTVYGGDYAILHGTAARWQPPGVDIVDADPLTWYETERPNILAAVRQAAALGLDELCWDLAVSAASLFQTRGHYDEWEETHRIALAATRAAGNTRGSAALLTGIGLLEAHRHRYGPAAAAVDEALELFERCADQHGWGLASSVAAFTAGMRGLYAEAVDRCGHALDAVRQAGDTGAEIFVLRLLGQLLLDVGHSARTYQDDPEVVYRIGELLLASGRLYEAEQAFTDLLSTVTDLEDLCGEAFARYGLGYLHLERNRHNAGEEYLHQAIELASAVDEPLVEAKAWLALGAASRSRGNHEAALHRFGRAEQLAQAIGAPLWEARALRQAARVHSERGSEASAAAARARLGELIAALGATASDIDAGVPSPQLS